MSRLQEAHIKFLERHLADLENGTITITVHDGYVARIEKQENTLFDEQEKLSEKEIIST